MTISLVFLFFYLSLLFCMGCVQGLFSCFFLSLYVLFFYLWRAICLEGCLFCVCDFFPVSVDGSTFSSLPDGLRHFYGDHNPYSILHIPYSMLSVIYDLEGSNDVNLQSTEFDPCR